MIVTDAAVERVGRQHQQEVASVAHVVHEVVVELSRPQSLDVEEDGEAANLQVHLQQAASTSHNCLQVHLQQAASTSHERSRMFGTDAAAYVSCARVVTSDCTWLAASR